MKHTHEPQNPPFPSQDEISQIYSEVIDHNHKSTGFGGAFSAIIGTLFEESNIDDSQGADTQAIDLNKDVHKSMVTKRLETDIRGDMVVFSSDDSMAAIGLCLEPTGAFLATTKGEKVSSRALVPRLSSPVRFSEFLGTLSLDSVESDKPLRTLADDVVRNLSDIVQLIYKPSPEKVLLGDRQAELEKVGEAQLSAFTSIADVYEELGLSNSSNFELMAEFVRRWGENVLPEYILAKEKAYLSPDIQVWGPASWQKDMSPENLVERWDEAMAFIQYLHQDPKKISFAKEVYGALEASMLIAQEWLADPTKHQQYPTEYIKTISPALDDLSKRFGKLKV